MNKKTFKQWFALMLLLLVGTMGTQAQSLKVNDFTVTPGEQTDVNIELTLGSLNAVYGVQTDLTLPNGLTLVGDPAVADGVMADKATAPTLSYNTANGRITLFSQAGKAIAEDGPVVKLTLAAAADFAGGELKLSGSRLTNSIQAGETTVADCTAQVSVPSDEGEVVANYTIDFNTSIDTSNREFAIASNWGHISGYDSAYDSNMSYNYNTTAGVDGTGALLAYRQYKYDWGQSSSGVNVYDLLITPQVKGTVSLAVKQYSGSNSYIEFYKMTDNGDGTFIRGDLVAYTLPEEASLSQTAYTTVSISLDDFTRIGIRASYMYLDNFVAEQATIVPEKAITIASATPTATTGTIYWDQQENGKVLVKYTVTVKNTGDVNLTQGMDGYSVSIVNGNTSDKVYSTVAVPQNLAVGETSDPFDVTAEVETTEWPYSYTYVQMNLRENLKGTTLERAQSRYNAYASAFVFRAAESTTTSSITTAESWGTITESTTKSFEIYNNGLAPLTIKSITLPDGFTAEGVPTIPAEGYTLEGKQLITISLTQDAATTGTFAGDLVIEYVNYGAEEPTNYTLAFAATVIGANTWTADFNNSTSTVIYPAGSIAESGIATDYQYISSGNYNNWLTGRTSSSYASENNKFITPKLHANAGDQLAFDTKAGYSSSNAYYVKVYVSTDRVNWGEPVAYYTYSTDADKGSEGIGSSFTTKTVSFDAEGDYYVAFALYGTSAIDNLVGLEKVDVVHDLYIKSVTWPDASIKSGTAQSKPSIDIIPLTDETADAYTVKYIYGDNEVEIASKALTASASSTTNFSASFTPEVTETTTFPGTKVVFEFTDGTKFETETFDLTVTNEAIFHFLSSKYSSRWYEPSSDYTTPVNFGKTNTAGGKKTFYVLNWGSAPLTVKSITVPEGFTASAESMNIPAFDGTQNGLETCQQALDITFSATEPGTYSGNLVITYVNGAGEDATFELALSGTMLDPTLFYANFGSESNQWPAGSVYQSNVSTTYVASGDYAISSSSTTKNLFITPKLTAQAGDKLLFDAKLYSTSWSEGKVVVYAAATRDELVNFDPEADTRTPIFTVSGQDETSPMTTDYQTFEIPAVAGDNYYAFEISGRPYVDEIYGLKVTEVAHDWMIASSNIPTEGMQNVALQATVNVANFGLADEAANSYTATLYVDGEAAATAEALALPMTHQLSAAGTALSFSFRSPKVGTFPVYIEVKAGDYSVQTEPVDVTFAEEIAVAEAIEVGTRTSADRNHGPINWYDNDGTATRWTDIVYTADELAAYGITAGAKITSIAFHGSGTSKSIKAKVTSWVGMKTGDITPGTVDKTAMTEVVVYDQTDAAAMIDFSNTVLDLSQAPIVYDGTSDIRIYTEAVGQGSGNWQTVTYAYDTNYMTSYYNSSTAVATPLGYFTLAAEPATIAGTVKDAAGTAIADATVTLVSTDGDNVQYTGTTDAEGAYSINVIQTARTYNVTASAEGYQDQTEENVSFTEGNVTKDFTLSLAPVKGDVNGDGDITTADAVAIVNIALSENEPTAEQLAVADLNGDGQITTADAVALVQLALEQEAPAGARRVDLSAGNRLSVNGSEVSLSNADEFVAFQMDVTLADDALLQGVQLADRVASHEVAYRRLDANTWRIAVFSLQNNAIMHNAGQLLQLQVSGSQQVALSNVEFVTADARACAVGLGETTSIHGVSTADASARYYNAAGQQREQMHKGMNIVVDRNGKAVKVLRK